MKKYSICNEEAAIFSTLILVGMGIGSAISPIISNMIQSRIKIMSWSCLGTIMTFSMIFFLPNISKNTMYILCFIAGIVNGGQILYFCACKEISPVNYSGTAIGFTNALVTLSGLIFQPLLGFLLEFFALRRKQDLSDKIVYNLSDYQLSFLFVIGSLCLGWLLLRYVKETYDTDLKKK
jgi:MFS family permease